MSVFSNKNKPAEHGRGEAFLNLFSILAWICLTGTYIWYGWVRSFNFDEFQVLYESVALLRGKALYADRLASHFPLLNIFLAQVVKITGFHPDALFVCRMLFSANLVLACVLIRAVARQVWDRSTALLAPALAMTVIVFLDKGIEIRHDCVSMTLVTASALFAVYYHKSNKISRLWIAAFFLGMAVAVTQKAAIWGVGLVLGLGIMRARDRGNWQVGNHGLGKEAFRLFAVFFLGGIIPPALVLGWTLAFTPESLDKMISITLLGGINYLKSSKSNAVYPFLYTKGQIWLPLLLFNGAFFTAGFSGLILGFFQRPKKSPFLILICCWAGMGMLYYLMTPRPFYQNLLPTLAPLSLLAAGFLVHGFRRMSSSGPVMGATAVFGGILLFFFWPLWGIFASELKEFETNRKNLENIAFCLNNLKPGDQVFSFSQQQVFFDPVVSMETFGQTCPGTVFTGMGKDCAARLIQDTGCKAVIFDHRTRILPLETRKMMAEHYTYAKVGEMFIPGFSVGPKASFSREIWVPGVYYCPTVEMKVDGRKITGNFAPLSKGTHKFENLTPLPVLFVYMFNPKKAGAGAPAGRGPETGQGPAS